MKLTKQHICAYLPYEVKCETSLGIMQLTRFQTTGIYKVWFEYNGKLKSKEYNAEILKNKGIIGKGYILSQIKLLLRPLSELHYYSNGLRRLDYEVGEYSINHIISKIKGRLCEYDIIEMCLKEHIDIFGLIDNGLAIDLNTLK